MDDLILQMATAFVNHKFFGDEEAERVEAIGKTVRIHFYGPANGKSVLDTTLLELLAFVWSTRK